jgi:hypothetical protein
MSSHRALSWSSATRDLRADRVTLPAGFLAARTRVEFTARTRGPLVVAGQFHRSAIMAAAAAAARSHQARTGSTWGEAMSVSLKAAWQVVKAARRVVAH